MASDHGHVHTVIVSGGGRAAAQAEGSWWADTVQRNVRRSLDGTCLMFASIKYPERYLAAVQYRFNRRFELNATMPISAGQVLHPWCFGHRALARDE